jgi:hypothetical protein
MKKAIVTVSFDAEKLKAVTLYMKQKDLSVEAELAEELEMLFQKYVPANVRSFLEMCADSSGTRRIRPPTSAVGGEQS